MLEEYKNSDIWKTNLDSIQLRSDILVTNRVVELLGDVSNLKILDAGCGNGKVSRLLSQKKAIVYGVDKVESQIKIAESVNKESQIKYFIGDSTGLDNLNLPKDFDIAISLMTFLYLNKEEFLQAAKQIHDHLKEG